MAEPPPAERAPPAPWLLPLLAAVYGVNYIDRQVVGILVQPLKHDLNITDAQVGVLTGLAFAAFYGVLGVPAARLAERYGPRRVIAGSVALFSAATIASAFSTSFGQLLCARIVVGIGEAGTFPASMGLIAGAYPAERRTGAVAAFTTGAQFGVLLGFVLGGVVAARYGWRAGFLVSGVPGLLLSSLVLRVAPDPRRAAGAARPAWAVVRGLLADGEFRLLCLAGGAGLFVVNAVVSWTPAYLQRAFHMNVATVGLIFGLAIGCGATAATWGSGLAADRLRRRGAGGPLLMGALSLLASAGLLLAGIWASSAALAVALIVPGLAIVAVWQAPLLSRLQDRVAEAERPTATSVYGLVATLIGLAFGPLTVGVVSDHVGHGSASGLRIGLSVGLLAALPGVAVLSVLVARLRAAAADVDAIAS